MIDNLKFLSEEFLKYSEKNPIWIFFFIGILILIFIGKKEAKEIFIFPYFFMCITIFNPILTNLFVEKLGFENRYLRFYWMLIYYVVIGYALTIFIWKIKKRIVRIAEIVVLSLIIVSTGIPVFSEGELTSYKVASNSGFTSGEIIELSNIFHSEGIERPKVLYDGWLLLNYRMYDPTVQSEVTRNNYLAITQMTEKEFLESDPGMGRARKALFKIYFYNDKNLSVDVFISAAKRRGLDYVVTSKNSELNDFFSEGAMHIMGASSNYYVWKFE